MTDYAESIWHEAIIRFLEAKESKGNLIGNGHHWAQEMATHIATGISKGFSSRLASQIDLEKLTKQLDDLRHYRDSTIGLWATDRKDLIQDPQNIMFRLGEEGVLPTVWTGKVE